MNVKDTLERLSPKERAALAVKIGVTERTIYRWATGVSKIDRAWEELLMRELAPAKKEKR